MNKFFILLVVFVLRCNAKTAAQNDSSFYKAPLVHNISAGYQMGNLIPHYDFMKAYQQKTIRAFTLSAEQKVNSSWSPFYNDVRRGLELHYTTLGHQEILGSAGHLAYFVKLGILSPRKASRPPRVHFKMGAGLGFLTNRFDFTDNHLNAVIGTYLNIAITSEISYDFTLNKKLLVSPFLKFTHYSNAAFKKPNLGLNLLTGGIKMNLEVAESKYVNRGCVFNSKPHFSTYIISGLNELRTANGIFPNASAGVQFIKQRLRFRFGAFADVQLSQAYAQADFLGLDKSSAWRASSGGIIGLQFGHSSLNADIGIYLRNQIPDIKPYFQRIYYQHEILNGLDVRFGIKAHGTVAETFELGISKRVFYL